MLSIIIASIIWVAVLVGLYEVGTVVVGVPNTQMLGFLAAIITILSPRGIYEALEVRRAKLALSNNDASHINSIEEFSIKPIYNLMLSTIMAFGIWYGGSFITGFLSGFIVSATQSSIPDERFINLIDQIHAVPLMVIFFLYLGYWIGTRSPRYGFSIAVGSIFLGYCLNVFGGPVIECMVIGGEKCKEWEGIAKPENLHDLQLYILLLIPLLIPLLIFLLVTIIGVWWGRRRRLMRYVGFILSILPNDTRRTIIEVARDEALRVAHCPDAPRAGNRNRQLQEK